MCVVSAQRDHSGKTTWTKKTLASHGMDSSFKKVDLLNFEIVFIIDMAGAHQKPY